MPQQAQELIAVCGLDCAACTIYQAAHDIDAAKGIYDLFVSQGWPTEAKDAREFLEAGPYCCGCRGDRSRHWSDNCAIMRCCLDEKKVDSCHVCDAFACQRLVDWAAQNDRYGAALERLRQMKADAQ